MVRPLVTGHEAEPHAGESGANWAEEKGEVVSLDLEPELNLGRSNAVLLCTPQAPFLAFVLG